MVIGDRIRKARKHAGFTQKQLAEKVEVSVQAISQLESGNSKQPKPTNLLKIAKATGTSFEWIATGKGQMIAAGTVEMTVGDYISGPLTGENHQAMEPPNGYHIIKTQELPLVTWSLSGNWPGIDAIDKEQIKHWYASPITHSSESFILTMMGDAMFPDYRDQDLIYVDTQATPQIGSDVIVERAGTTGPIIRRIKQDGDQRYLVAVNHDYRSFPLTDDDKIIGVIIFSGRIS